MSSPGAYLETYYGGSYDAFLTKFDTDGNRYWGSYYEGEDVDYAYAVAAFGTDVVYLAGHTFSASNITSPGAYQINHATGGGGSSDGFLVKFSNDTTAHIFMPSIQATFDFIAYPSPGSGSLTIELDKTYSNVSVKVFNILGQTVFTEFIANSQIFSLELLQARGVYFIEISTNHYRSIKKILIE